MASSLKNLSTYDESNIPSAEGRSFAIVVSDYHNDITHKLYEGCYETLVKHGADPEKIYTTQVPGTYELPVGARMINNKHQPDAVICLGCVIKGETTHNEYINQSVATALMQLGIMANKAFVFGVLTPNDEQQAKDRSGGQHGNKGVEAAVSAIRMAALKKEMQDSKKKIGFGA